MLESRVLGIRVHAVTMADALDTVDRFVREGGPHLVVTLGTEMVMAAQQDNRFREAVENAALVVPDAVGVVWASRRTAQPLPSKVAGVDMVAEMARLSGERGWRMFFLGAAEGVAEEAAQALAKRFPGFAVAGTHNGFFKDDAAVVEQINASGANVLLLALGSPRQEMWYWQHRHELKAAVGMGVGGSFDVFAGRAERAPQWMISLGLEWLHRLVQQPSRWRRMLALPRFVVAVLTRRS
ncbi:MAG: WecB/TagA/CpsF family glycosyltransferase [Candidatus Xenobia bacterium]